MSVSPGKFLGCKPALAGLLRGWCKALVTGSNNRKLSEYPQYYPYVTELNGFITWNVLFKNEMWLLLGSFI